MGIVRSVREVCRSPSTATDHTTAPQTSMTQSSPSISRQPPVTSICRHRRIPTTDSGWMQTSTSPKTTTSVRTPRSPRFSSNGPRGDGALTLRRRPETFMRRGRRTTGSTRRWNDGGNDREEPERRRRRMEWTTNSSSLNTKLTTTI